ncbi:MAG TPA: response regulator [Gemmatimonadales bacterium]|nr:response regulator [Gemmatimonadales bacterium]
MAPPTLPLRPVIGVIDDDPSVLKSLVRLLRATGFFVVPFASTELFLETHQAWTLHCLVLDVHFEGMSGFDLETYLTDSGLRFPIVFITAHDDAALRERVEATGQAFLRKPFEDTALLEAINRMLAAPPAPAASAGPLSKKKPRGVP